MMAAMMFPAVAPTALTYDSFRERQRARGEGGRRCDGALRGRLSSGLDGGGLAAYTLIEFVRAIDPAFLAWDEAGRYVTGGVIVAAAVYQVTPLKRACLAECRSPMTFLAERWRDGRAGALALGIRPAPGASAAGALMAALFAVGVMSVGWMVLIAAFIVAEEAAPLAHSHAGGRGPGAGSARAGRCVLPGRRAGLRRAGR